MAERSDEEIRETAERVVRELDLHEAEAKARGERFERIDEQTLLRKLAGDEADSPFLTGMSWPNLPPGGAGTVRVDVQNPDPFIYAGVFTFVYMFFGPANIIQSIDMSLTAPVDTRLPHYSQPVTLPANGSGTATFPVAVPPNVTRGAYVGNVYLVQSGAFGSGQVYDRASFGLVVT